MMSISRVYSMLGGLLLILAFNNSLATTLGEINVLSAVGEPFSATIEVQLSGTDSSDQMIARIASADKHTAFGISYADYASTITVEVVQRKEKLLLVLNSAKDLREVYLEFIFQLRFVEGSIYRAYSVLPDFNIPQMGDTEKNPHRANRPKKKIPAGSYTVKSLDSLWLIAAAMDRKLGSVTQRIRLLEAANPTLENGEMHPGDTLIIPADRLPINKPAATQKSDSTSESIDKTVTLPVSTPANTTISTPATKNVIPSFASEKELAAVARRAAGYRIVRLTAHSGPQFSQSESGAATLSKDSNDSMSLELEEIRENLEALAQENVILTGDIRRLEVQNQQQQRESIKQERRYPLPESQTAGEEKDTLLTKGPQPKASVNEEVSRDSAGISNAVLFFIAIILISLVGFILWYKRRQHDETLSTTEPTQDQTKPFSKKAEAPVKTAVKKFNLVKGESTERTERTERTESIAADNSPTQNIAANNNSPDESVSSDQPPRPAGLMTQPLTSNSGETNTDLGKPSAAPHGTNNGADKEGIDFQSQSAQAQEKATEPKIEDPQTLDQPINTFPPKDTIDFVPVDKQVDKPITQPETTPNKFKAGTWAPPKFEDPKFREEFLEELKHDESETVDLDFELELDPEIESAVLEEEEIQFEDEDEDEGEAKSMSDVFEDIHLHDGSDHESPTSSQSVSQNSDQSSSPSISTEEPNKGDAGLTDKVARWAKLQQEWDAAIAPGIASAVDAGQSLAVAYIELDDMANIEDQQGPMRTEGLITQAQNLLADSMQTHARSLHRIKDHTFLFLCHYKTETELRERGKALVRMIQDHEFVVRSEHLKLSLSVGIVPFTTLFNSLDDYLRCGKRTVEQLRTELTKARISGGVAIHFEGRNETEDWENEEEFLAKVSELLEANLFEVEYQTLINLSGNHQQVYMCKTELSPEVDIQALPVNFLKKAFTCSATPEIERQSIMTFMDKIRSLGDDSVKMLFRIDIRSAMDPQFGGWLFQQLEVKGIDPTSITLFVYADDVIAHKPHIMSFAATLRQHGSRLGMLNVDYDANHLQAALDVGASIVRINPSIVDDVVESSVRFGSRPVTSGTRESSRFKDFLTSFQKRDIETVLFSTYVEAIPGLVVLNASNLRASYIQTPIGMISDDHF